MLTFQNHFIFDFLILIFNVKKGWKRLPEFSGVETSAFFCLAIYSQKEKEKNYKW
jgi:hypothetical protein